MRSIKELLAVMLEHKSLFINGLCLWASDLNWRGIISHDEFRLLQQYIDNNRPSKYSSLSAFNYRHSSFYWKCGDIIPRVKWINKHLQKK